MIILRKKSVIYVLNSFFSSSFYCNGPLKATNVGTTSVEATTVEANTVEAIYIKATTVEDTTEYYY